MLWEPPRSDRYFYILVQKSIFSSQISFLDTFNLRTKNVLDFEFSRQKADPILNLSPEYLCQKKLPRCNLECSDNVPQLS